MTDMRILITGASGLLGKQLKLEADRPAHGQLDITESVIAKDYDLIIHAAAYTDVAKAEAEGRQECFEVNVIGTMNLLNAYPVTPFVYISSEYAGNPVNFYSLCKRVAEDQVRWKHPHYLIIRTLFKPFPYPYEFAFIDQMTQGDTVDIIAPLIEKEILEWDGQSKLVYVGTGRKTMFELARKSRPDIRPNSIKDMKVKLPNDYL